MSLMHGANMKKTEDYLQFAMLQMQIILSLIITAQSLAGNGRLVRIPAARLRLSPPNPSCTLLRQPAQAVTASACVS